MPTTKINYDARKYGEKIQGQFILMDLGRFHFVKENSHFSHDY